MDIKKNQKAISAREIKMCFLSLSLEQFV